MDAKKEVDALVEVTRNMIVDKYYDLENLFEDQNHV